MMEIDQSILKFDNIKNYKITVKMINIKIISILFIAFSLLACPGESYDEKPIGYFKLQNKCGEEIYLDFRQSEVVLSPNNFNEVPMVKVLNNNSFEDRVTESSFSNNKKMWFIVYKKSTREFHTWQEIIDQGLYDKRYSFSLEELKAINFQIIYDGN